MSKRALEHQESSIESDIDITELRRPTKRSRRDSGEISAQMVSLSESTISWASTLVKTSVSVTLEKSRYVKAKHLTDVQERILVRLRALQRPKDAISFADYNKLSLENSRLAEAVEEQTKELQRLKDERDSQRAELHREKEERKLFLRRRDELERHHERIHRDKLHPLLKTADDELDIPTTSRSNVFDLAERKKSFAKMNMEYHEPLETLRAEISSTAENINEKTKATRDLITSIHKIADILSALRSNTPK